MLAALRALPRLGRAHSSRLARLVGPSSPPAPPPCALLGGSRIYSGQEASPATLKDRLSVIQLKHFLDAAGVDYRDCVEKGELADRLQQARSNLPAPLRNDLAHLLDSPSPRSLPSTHIHELTQEEQRSIQVFEDCAPSVVHITTSTQVQHPFSLDIAEIPQGTGSGFVWDAQGHVVTNFHVVQKAARAKVSLSDNSSWEGRLVGAEPDKDLAVLRIDHERGEGGQALKPLRVGSSSSIRVGQRVFAIGNPFGLDQTLTSGIVSGVGRDIQGFTGRKIRGVVQTDAAINPGNSGGPLLDSQGRLVGVNTMIMSPSGASSGVGFAVPADTVRRVVNQLIRHGRVTKPSLGVNCAAHQQSTQLGMSGVLVLSVLPGSGADRAGIRGVSKTGWGEVTLGDEIVAVNGQEVHSAEDIIGVIEMCEVGEAAAVRVRRKGETLDLVVPLQSRAE